MFLTDVEVVFHSLAHWPKPNGGPDGLLDPGIACCPPMLSFAGGRFKISACLLNFGRLKARKHPKFQRNGNDLHTAPVSAGD